MRLDEQRLLADIKAGKLARVYLLYGEEDFLIRLYTEKLIDLAVPEEAREMNFRKYFLTSKPGDNKMPPPEDCPPKVDELSDFAESMPFFSDHKCVLLKNLDVEMLDDDEFKGYISLLSDLPEETVVIITRENTESDIQKFRKQLEKAKMKKLIKAVDDHGIVCELDQFPTAKLAGMAIAKCRRAGCELSEANAALLAESCGGSLSLMQTEAEKLCAYRKNAEITREDIEALVPKRLEENIYDLAKELFAGRTSRALEILDAMFFNKIEPVIVMAALSGYFVDLYRAKIAIEAKKSYSDAAAMMNYKNRAFALKNAYGPARRLSEQYLSDCIALLYNANKLLNSSRTEKRLTLERTIVELANYR